MVFRRHRDTLRALVSKIQRCPISLIFRLVGKGCPNGRIILFLGSWVFGAEDWTNRVGDFDEGSNCGNVSFLFFFLLSCSLRRSYFREGFRNRWKCCATRCSILSTVMIYRDTMNFTVNFQHIIFHCCDLIYIFELLYVYTNGGYKAK